MRYVIYRAHRANLITEAASLEDAVELVNALILEGGHDYFYEVIYEV